jgi:hypothetical protein
LHKWANFILNANGPTTSIWTTDSEQPAIHWKGTTDLNGPLAESAYVSGSVHELGANRFEALWRYSLFTYNPLELYLMGLSPAADVPDIHLFGGVTEISRTPVDGSKTDSRIEFEAESLKTIPIADILKYQGPRIPAYPNAQNHFRALMVAVTEAPPTEDQWAVLLDEVEQFSRTDGMVKDPVAFGNFYENTGHRATFQFNALHRALK